MVQAVLPQANVQLRARQAEAFGGFRLVAAALAHHLINRVALDRVRVERMTGVSLETLSTFAQRLSIARYGAWFHGPNLGRGRRGSACVEAALGLGACLADDMGLGKTVQVIALLLTLKGTSEPSAKDRKKAAPSLLVVPASLIANWKAEIERFAPSLTYAIVHPSEAPAGKEELAAADVADRIAGAVSASGTTVVRTAVAMGAGGCTRLRHAGGRATGRLQQPCHVAI